MLVIITSLFTNEKIMKSPILGKFKQVNGLWIQAVIASDWEKAGYKLYWLFKSDNCIQLFRDYLLEDEDHFLDVSGGDEVHGKREGLPPDLEVRRAQDSQDVHNDLLQDLLVLRRVLKRNW